jgi:SAM-dependent methyltransferase
MEQKNYEQQVKERYAAEAKKGTSEKLLKQTGCCGNKNVLRDISQHLGYSSEQLDLAPEDANLGLGCGNPLAFACIKKGDTVLDLGCGGGFDSFIASPLVGENGKVIGVDFTPEMIEKAILNAKNGNYRNVEFILANIDSIPLPNDTADLIISNCVINLAPDKQKVFNEAHRILKNGGHLSISDTMLTRDLYKNVLRALGKYVNCFSGAVKKDTYQQMLTKARFKNIKITKENHYPLELMLTDPIAQAIISELKPSNEEIKETLDSIVSVSFYAEK